MGEMEGDWRMRWEDRGEGKRPKGRIREKENRERYEREIERGIEEREKDGGRAEHRGDGRRRGRGIGGGWQQSDGGPEIQPSSCSRPERGMKGKRGDK